MICKGVLGPDWSSEISRLYQDCLALINASHRQIVEHEEISILRPYIYIIILYDMNIIILYEFSTGLHF